MPSYTPSTLATLRDRRLDGERQAERVLAGAVVARRQAEAEAAQLEAEVSRAVTALQAARSSSGAGASQSAADAQATRRFWQRLEGDLHKATRALEHHRDGALTATVRGDEEARAAHLLARRRRELVDKAITRREAALHRERDRRLEAATDDLPQRPR